MLPSEIVDTIYILAEAQSLTGLKAFLEQENVSVDAEFNGLCAITRLAQENKIDAVNFLITHFDARYDWAAKGYGMGGFIEEGRKLLEKGANPDYLTWGLAYGGFVKLVKERLQLGDNINMALMGYAEAVFFYQAEQLLDKGADPMAYAYALAAGGHMQKVLDWLNDLEEDQLKEAQKEAIKGFSLYNRMHDMELEDFQNIAVRFYALGVHEGQVNLLLEQGASTDEAACGYAEAGHFNLARSLPAHLDVVAYGAAIGAHIKAVNQFVEEGATHSKVIDGLEADKHLQKNEILRTASLINDHALRISLIHRANAIDPSIDEQHILTQATQLNKLIQEKGLSFEQAQAAAKQNLSSVQSGFNFFSDSATVLSSDETKPGMTI